MIEAGQIKVKLKTNPKQLYEHQVEALEVLKKIEQHDSFKSILVIPTGGRKDTNCLLVVVKWCT